MRKVGHRRLPEVTLRPSGEQLRAASAINDSLTALLPGGQIAAPRGVYLFRTLEEANRQQEAWLAELMVLRRG